MLPKTKLLSALTALIGFLLLVHTASRAQMSQATTPLSKKAQRGILWDAVLTPDGGLRLCYKMKTDKRSEELQYEDYVFDASLQCKGPAPFQLSKESKPNKTVTNLVAYVGGGNSFNVMSMSLALQQEQWERNWNFERQQYRWGSRLSKAWVKPRNTESKYKGFQAYSDDDAGTVVVLASYDQDKDDADQFVQFLVQPDLQLTEMKFPLQGAYSVVYTKPLKDAQMLTVFAPNKGNGNPQDYKLFITNAANQLVQTINLKSPSPNLVVTGVKQEGKAIYLIGASTKSKEAYNEEFAHYAPISNPGYSTSANRYMDKYDRKFYNADFTQVHLIKIENGSQQFATTASLADCAAKLKLPAGQRKGDAYEGKPFVVDAMQVAPNGDVFVTAQLTDKKIVNGGKDMEYKYYDYLAFQFSPQGVLKAQFTADKVMNDSKSEVFASPQQFLMSADGKTAYWQILEVKGSKGYSSVADAFNGNTTTTAHYFPRLAKLDLGSSTLGEFSSFDAKGKFLLNRDYATVVDEKSGYVFYVGHDEDLEQAWVGKFKIQ